MEKIIMIKLIKCLVKKLNKISGYHNYLIFQPKILLFSSAFIHMHLLNVTRIYTKFFVILIKKCMNHISPNNLVIMNTQVDSTHFFSSTR